MLVCRDNGVAVAADLYPELSCVNGLNKELPMVLKTVVVAPTNDNGAILCLFENLNLIKSNKEKIWATPEFNTIQISGVYVGGLYVGVYQIRLGDLIKLWDETEWHNDNKYYYNIIGTPLSGMNTANWYDEKNNTFGSGTYSNGKLRFLGLARPAFNQIKKNQTKEPISKLTVFDLVQQLRTKICHEAQTPQK